MKAADLKGGDVLADGREVFDTLRGAGHTTIVRFLVGCAIQVPNDQEFELAS
jgi:hypothetical protein